MPSPHEPACPSPRQRWTAAQRLALGESVETAAAFADIELEALDALLTDQRFLLHIEAEQGKLDLDEEAWQRRLRLELRQVVERALADGKVSVLNTLLRGSAAPPTAATPDVHGKPAAAAKPRIASKPPASPAADPALVANPATDAAEPVPEPRHQALLALVNPALRPILAESPLELIEHYAAATDPDPTVYETWRQARLMPAAEAATLPDTDLSAIRHVTRHNAAWLRGSYLGCHRPPVPVEAFGADEAGRPTTAAPMAAADAVAAEPKTARSETPVAALRRRVVRLLDRNLPRLAEELDLAEAVCAVLWPNWPAYGGPIDLGELRVALAPMAIDPATLHWLGSRELAEACRTAQPQAP